MQAHAQPLHASARLVACSQKFRLYSSAGKDDPELQLLSKADFGKVRSPVPPSCQHARVAPTQQTQCTPDCDWIPGLHLQPYEELGTHEQQHVAGRKGELHRRAQQEHREGEVRSGAGIRQCIMT